jgi:hypothetical protein
MAKDDKIQGESQNAQEKVGSDRSAQQRQLRFVEEGVKTQYSNVFNIGFGAEEVIFIFGNHSVDPNVVRIESKMAVSIKTAKRIAVTLGNLLRRYEAINGEIDISMPKGMKEDKPNIQ